MEAARERIKLNYERRGCGKPVLILHGWGANIQAVKPIADCVVHLGREAVSIDFPGHGEAKISREMPLPMPFSVIFSPIHIASAVPPAMLMPTSA